MDGFIRCTLPPREVEGGREGGGPPHGGQQAVDCNSPATDRDRDKNTHITPYLMMKARPGQWAWGSCTGRPT
eukprot:scaffold21491_cov37-Tisochrysis_lutea.AAC.4